MASPPDSFSGREIRHPGDVERGCGSMVPSLTDLGVASQVLRGPPKTLTARRACRADRGSAWTEPTRVKPLFD